MNQDEVKAKTDEMIAKAQPANEDTEEMLVELARLAEARRVDPRIEERYEYLRSVLTKRLEREGPRFYLDEHGDKVYAYPVIPEPVVVDVAGLVAMADAGEISHELLEEIAPRKADMEAFARAAARGSRPNPRREGIKPEQLVQVARKRRGTGHVRFHAVETNAGEISTEP